MFGAKLVKCGEKIHRQHTGTLCMHEILFVSTQRHGEDEKLCGCIRPV